MIACCAGRDAWARSRIGLHVCLRGISSKAAECRVSSDAFQTLMRKMRRNIGMGCMHSRSRLRGGVVRQWPIVLHQLLFEGYERTTIRMAGASIVR